MFKLQNTCSVWCGRKCVWHGTGIIINISMTRCILTIISIIDIQTEQSVQASLTHFKYIETEIMKCYREYFPSLAFKTSEHIHVTMRCLSQFWVVFAALVEEKRLKQHLFSEQVACSPK